MSIPNTTPTPNELYNGEMKKMSDTELRVVLIVTRSTLGWELDHKTGMRKIEDWISHSQLINRTGRGSKSISRAVDNCVKMGWIETRTKEGRLLKTAQERRLHGRKIFYRLGKIFLSKVTIVKKTMVDEPSSLSPQTIVIKSTEPSSKGRTTKESITKESIQKEANKFAVNELIDLFKSINPSFERLFKNKTQRLAIERMADKFGEDKLIKLIEILPKTNEMQYAPSITTPLQLEQKMGSLKVFLQKRNEEIKKNQPIII